MMHMNDRRVQRKQDILRLKMMQYIGAELLRTNKSSISLLPLRSIESIQKCSVEFVNMTSKKVIITWVDFQGRKVPYKVLFPGKSAKLCTYKTHPWIFEEYYSGERMYVNHKEYFLPEPKHFEQNQGEPGIVREAIPIHYPLHTLSESAMWIICKNIRNITDIDKLHLPLKLKCEMKNIFHQLYVHQNIIKFSNRAAERM